MERNQFLLRIDVKERFWQEKQFKGRTIRKVMGGGGGGGEVEKKNSYKGKCRKNSCKEKPKERNSYTRWAAF